MVGYLRPNFLALVISLVFPTYGFEISKKICSRVLRDLGRKRRWWRSSIGVRHFSKPENHEDRAVSTFVKSDLFFNGCKIDKNTCTDLLERLFV